MERQSHLSPDAAAVARTLESCVTQSGKSIVELSSVSPVLLVFLRHAGCAFCREALADIARSRAAIEQGGTRIVLVHMGDIQALQGLLSKHGLSGLDRICDPTQELYGAFGVKRGTTLQLFGPKVLWRGFLAGVLARYGLGRVRADASQMPAIFLIENSAIVRRFRHRSAADRPDYIGLCARPSAESQC